ncbi:hypothetical protein [Thalassomonas haliotis]|uniref:Uncharacterized protein n=1 Tax=Thalassomonas haliotis TaxID=485448 RepID=A0ABY7VM46_9GAMM|nr:hypothetical protein [Thalassomonas haliotis]WDE14257.1 hypothetical protein H3N35_13055 [Thalassomonas haliotis]
MAIISLQSAFAVTDFSDSCKLSQAVSAKSGYMAEYAGQAKAGPLDTQGQGAQHEDCAECSCKSCPCCSNVTFALGALFPLFDSLEPFRFAFEPTRFDSPYYLLLRPPKI